MPVWFAEFILRGQIFREKKLSVCKLGKIFSFSSSIVVQMLHRNDTETDLYTYVKKSFSSFFIKNNAFRFYILLPFLCFLFCEFFNFLMYIYRVIGKRNLEGREVKANRRRKTKSGIKIECRILQEILWGLFSFRNFHRRNENWASFKKKIKQWNYLEYEKLPENWAQEVEGKHWTQFSMRNVTRWHVFFVLFLYLRSLRSTCNWVSLNIALF